MARGRYPPEQITAKLREAEVFLSPASRVPLSAPQETDEWTPYETICPIGHRKPNMSVSPRF